MGEDQKRALAQRLAEDEDFRAAMASASSLEEVSRVAADHGLVISDLDVLATDPDGLSDAELESVSGGTILHPTMSVFCGTNGNFCTFNPYACQSPG